ncbi:MAG TPA: hypothetical protein VHJ34_15855, partial [Actinomycetota bacterium]|nr:hypothetical protein [Actinomycetota bacterium]
SRCAPGSRVGSLEVRSAPGEGRRSGRWFPVVRRAAGPTAVASRVSDGVTVQPVVHLRPPGAGSG